MYIYRDICTGVCVWSSLTVLLLVVLRAVCQADWAFYLSFSESVLFICSWVGCSSYLHPASRIRTSKKIEGQQSTSSPAPLLDTSLLLCFSQHVV